MKTGIVFGIAITLLILISVGGAYFLGTQNKKVSEKVITTSEPVLIPTSIPTPEAEKSDIPPGWMTYKNEEYGFEISYPENYKALDDEENLYGWPDAVVLIYGGGQSYDLPIEIWDNASEYENKYPNADNLIVKQVGNKYITLLNMNFEAEVDAIIETFIVTE
jgi:hypothetical protein